MLGSTIFFLVFIPFLAFVLLALSVLLGPHSPYAEKLAQFECGFSSFRGQNRQEFSISFFIFGLLFLLFDIEIILIYPYAVSSYNNSYYGLVFVIVFILILTAGFVFELGRKALQINSKQTGYLQSSTFSESSKKGINGRPSINLYHTRRMSYVIKRSERRHYSTKKNMFPEFKSTS